MKIKDVLNRFYAFMGDFFIKTKNCERVPNRNKMRISNILRILKIADEESIIGDMKKHDQKIDNCKKNT